MRQDPLKALPFLHGLSGAVSIRAIYPPKHPRVGEAIRRMKTDLKECLKDRGADEITFLIIDRELLVDDRPIRSHQGHLASLVRTVTRRGIERLTFSRDVGDEECQRLVDGLAGSSELESSPHIVLGRIQLGDALAEGGEEERPEWGWGDLSETDVDQMEESFLRFRSDSVGSIDELDRLLWRFVENMDKTSRSLLVLAPMKAADQRLFMHSINVSLLTLAQARGLGVEGQTLHDIGFAALLHDIGMLSIPRSLFEKTGGYSEIEWEIVTRHPELGAAQLCGLAGAPPLTVIVAYEHHLRWDGKPSFPKPAVPRLPCLASQLTAIADTYDIMIASRGLSGGAGGKEALGVWQERSGTYLDPFLVGNFMMTLVDVGG